MIVFWFGLRRLAHIMSVIGRHVLAHAAGRLLDRLPLLARLFPEHRSRSGPERLRLMFEDVGGTFIKFGQMLALQPDIISLEYCNELFNLLDRVAPFDFAQAEKIFVEELGRGPTDIFDAFDQQPVATASIGQVHVAYLGGRKLAVKVQRPNVESDFGGDIRMLKASVKLIKSLRLRALSWLIEPMSEFINWTTEELDYRNEARYMEQLRRNARNNAHERVPAVLWNYTTRRLLVAEFLEGETVLGFLRAQDAGDEILLHRLKSTGFDARAVARNIIDNFLGDVFKHGMFHADLHPANLLILPDSVVGYIDFGITGVISRYSRQNLIALTLCYTRADLDGMCQSFFKVSALNENSDVEGFREGLKRLADDWYESEGEERCLRKNFTLVMLDMLKLSRLTGIWPERDVIKYIRSAIAIDGLITRFAPTFNIGRHLNMVCHSYLKWQGGRAFFTYDTLVSWINSGGHLLRDGAFRADNFLCRIVSGEMSSRAEYDGRRGETSDALRLRALQLGAILFTISIIMSFTGERVQLGVNLFTGEIIFLVSAAMMLLRTVRRLAQQGD